MANAGPITDRWAAVAGAPPEVRPVVMLDRDGVLVDELGHPDFAEGGPLMRPGVVDALVAIKAAGALLSVITNQSAIGAGRLECDIAVRVHESILRDIDPHRELIDFWAMCPHGRDHGCSCRKPGVGAVRALEERYGLVVQDGWFVGDQSSDILCGRRLGLRTMLVRSTDATRYAAAAGTRPDADVTSLADGATLISEDLRAAADRRIT